VKNPFHADGCTAPATWPNGCEWRAAGARPHRSPGQTARFRIELGEIEAALMRRNTLSAVAVLLREDNPGAPRLVAYYVEPAGHAQSPAQLSASIADDLPEYMIPTGWMKLPAPAGLTQR